MVKTKLWKQLGNTSQNQTVNQIQYFHISKCTSFSASTLIFLLHNNLFSDLWICCCFFNCFVVWHCNWLQASYNLQNEFPWMLLYTLPLLHWISASLTLTFACIFHFFFHTKSFLSPSFKVSKRQNIHKIKLVRHFLREKCRLHSLSVCCVGDSSAAPWHDIWNIQKTGVAAILFLNICSLQET